MTNHLVFCAFTVLALTYTLQFQAHASPSGKPVFPYLFYLFSKGYPKV